MSQLSDKVKLDLREFLRKVYRETKGRVSIEDWDDFEELFWKIYPIIQEKYVHINEEVENNDKPIVVYSG